jgi:hypothetical protein
MCDCDLLPVRWGTVLDDDGVEELLEARHAELQDALERVRGAVELAVRVAGGASATEVHEMLSTLARESRQLALGRGAYLVAREDVEDFVVTIAALEEANDDLSILCTGPWPPYSFVTA